jgi:hypothetical protein
MDVQYCDVYRMLKASASRRLRCVTHAPRSADSIAVMATNIPAASQEMPLCAAATRCASTEERSDANSNVSESSDGTLHFLPSIPAEHCDRSEHQFVEMRFAFPWIHVNEMRQSYTYTNNLLCPSQDSHLRKQYAPQPTPLLRTEKQPVLRHNLDAKNPRFSSRLP